MKLFDFSLPQEAGSYLEQILLFRRIAVRAVILVGLPVITLFLLIQVFYEARPLVGYWVFFTLVALLAALYLYLRIDDPEKESFFYDMFFRSFLLCLSLYLLYAIGIEGKFNRFPWYFLFPFVAFYAVEIREGITWVGLFFLASVFVLLTQDYQLTPATVFGLKVRLLTLLALTGLIAFLTSFVIRGTVKGLFERQVALRDSEARYREALAELQEEIRNRERAEVSLGESEEKYRMLVETMYEGLGILDENRIFTYANQRLCEMLGYSERALLGRPVTDFLDEANQRILDEEVEKRRRGEMNSYELTWTTERGEALHTIVSPNVIKGDGGKVRGFFAVVTDITERKRAEQVLMESEKKYRLLVENAEDAVFIAQDGLIKFANPATLSILGYSEQRVEETGEIRFIQHIHPEERDAILDRHVSRLKGEEVPSSYSFRLVRKTGEVIWGDINVVLITWEGRPAALNFLRDKTHQKKLEEQLQQAQRLEAIGTLAGGIAHDFNNLLMGIQGNASLMLLDRDPGHPDFEMLKNIETYVQNGAELTKQLLGFARGGRYHVRPTDLNELIDRSSRMFGRTRKEIRIHSKYQKDIWMVEADQGQMEQVLLNLYVNAWQAMPGGGELYIGTENVRVQEDFIKAFQARPGRYVKISVTDTGVGMDKETRAKIFDPFFTTKEMGRGTGLGLASVYGIVKNHEGIIDVQSKKGEGTTFHIYLPASHRALTGEGDSLEELVGGEEGVLLVDDEEMIIDVGKKMLEKLGYEVTLARSGVEALEVYKEHRDRIELVILDLIMPEMDGGDTYDQLKAIDPSVKVLLSSGYSMDGHAQEVLARGCQGFIQKPFDLRDLSRLVRRVLDSESSSDAP